MHTKTEVNFRTNDKTGETTNPIYFSAYALPNDEVQWPGTLSALDSC